MPECSPVYLNEIVTIWFLFFFYFKNKTLRENPLVNININNIK